MTTISGHTAPAVSNWLLALICQQQCLIGSLHWYVSYNHTGETYIISGSCSELSSLGPNEWHAVTVQWSHTPWGLARSPWSRPLTASLREGEGAQHWSNVLSKLWNRTLLHSVVSRDVVHWTPLSHYTSCGWTYNGPLAGPSSRAVWANSDQAYLAMPDQLSVG